MFETSGCLPWAILLFMAYGIYYLSMRALNLRYERALNHLLGKEIARRIYQQIHPEFTYNKYHVDDDKREVVLNSCIEEFKKLSS